MAEERAVIGGGGKEAVIGGCDEEAVTTVTVMKRL